MSSRVHIIACDSFTSHGEKIATTCPFCSDGATERNRMVDGNWNESVVFRTTEEKR